jgi:hypothetical protein
MAHAYTPGLQVTPKTLIEKTRTLPLPGEVLVREGDRVAADQAIATTDFPGDVVTVNVVNQLGIEPSDIHEFMLKKEGEAIREGEPLAENKPFIKWFKTTIRSPITGSVESISNVTGQVLLRNPPRKITLLAYIDGVITEVLPNSGATIATAATFVQGILGIGGERIGELVQATETPEEIFRADLIRPEHKGKILFGGSLIQADGLKKALELGVGGIIVGGFNAHDLKEWLGYELGVAITGDEDVVTSLILTEGFGQIAMARRTFDLLVANVGRRASISGRTQIRAGVMRPEVIIPLADQQDPLAISIPHKEQGLCIGNPVRVIRDPYFGRLGKVAELPSELMRVETEAKVRIMKVELANGEIITVPRANVETIEV